MTRRKVDIRQQSFGFPDEDLKTSLHDEIVLWLKKNANGIGRQLVCWKDSWDQELLDALQTQTAVAVARRKELLQEALPKNQKRLEDIGRGGSRFGNEDDLDRRVPLMVAELEFLKAWSGLREPPVPDLDVSPVLEWPIQRERYQTTDIVGYADVVFRVRATEVSVGSLPTNDYGTPQLGVDPRRYADWQITWKDRGTFAFDAKSEIRSLGELIRQLRTYQVFSQLPFYVVSPDSRFAVEISDEGFGFINYPTLDITFSKRKRAPRH